MKNNRTCIVTKKSESVAQMLRFVASPDNFLVPDIRGNLPGRGAWITARRDILSEAIKRKAFARSLKQEIHIKDDLVDLTDQLLTKAALGSFAIARKAGAIVVGASKVDLTIRSSQAAMVLHAKEAAEDSKRKIAQAIFSAKKQGWEDVPVFELFTGDEMSLAFGDKHVIHAAVLKGVASDGFIKWAQKLQFYRSEPVNVTDKAVKEAETG